MCEPNHGANIFVGYCWNTSLASMLLYNGIVFVVRFAVSSL